MPVLSSLKSCQRVNLIFQMFVLHGQTCTTMKNGEQKLVAFQHGTVIHSLKKSVQQERQ